MKRILCKSGEIKSLAGLYNAIQDANIANAKEYLRSFVLTPGLRLDGDAWLVSASQGNLVIQLGACVFNDYEVFVAPANTTVSIALPELDELILTNAAYSVILERRYEESHYRHIRPLEGFNVELEVPTLRRTGVVVKVVEGGVEDEDSEILLATIHFHQGSTVVTDLRYQSCMSILSYYSSWGMSSLAPVDVHSLSTHIQSAGASGALLESLAQSETHVTVKWAKPMSIGLWEVRGPIYYKARLVPVDDDGEHPEFAIEACVPYDVADDSSFVTTAIPCCPGVYYKAYVFQAAGPTNLILSEEGKTKHILAGQSPLEPQIAMGLFVAYPGYIGAFQWHQKYFMVRPEPSTPVRRIQLFVKEHESDPGQMTFLRHLYYDGPPKTMYYIPSDTEGKVSFLARAIGDSGVVVGESVVQTYDRVKSEINLSAAEDMLVLKAPISGDFMFVPGGDLIDNVDFGFVEAPWDLVITKMIVSNPYKDDVIGTDPYPGIGNDATVTITDDAFAPLAVYASLTIEAALDGEGFIVYDEAALKEDPVPQGTKIGITIERMVAPNQINPHGLLVFLYVKRVL